MFANDNLPDASWKQWQELVAYPKRAAFKNGKLFAFCAGVSKDSLMWWDAKGRTTRTLPDSKAKDDKEFIKKYCPAALPEIEDDPDAIDYITKTGSIEDRKKLLDNPNTTRKTFELLASDPDKKTRAAVAISSNTPDDIVERLAGDKDKTVRMAAARRDSGSEIQASVFERLAKDESESVRLNVAMNQSTPEEVLLSLVDSEEESDIRRAAISNNNFPRKYLGLYDHDPDIRRCS